MAFFPNLVESDPSSLTSLPSVSSQSSDSSIHTKLNSSFLIVSSDIVSRLEALAIANILEDCIDQLHIINYNNRIPKHEPDMEYVSLPRRFRGRNNRIIDVEKDMPVKQATDMKRFDKVQADCGFCAKVLELTRKDLLRNGTFKSLVYYVEQEQWTRDEEDTLLRNEEQNSAKVHLKRNQLLTERQLGQEIEHQKDQTIAQIRDSLDQKMFVSQKQLHYNAAWEKTRCEQHALRSEMKEAKLRDELDAIQYSHETETRVHLEITAFILQSEADLEKQIEAWKAKYEKEYEKKDLLLNTLRQRRTENLERFQQISALFEQRQTEIDEYKAICAEKERVAAQAAFMAKMATRIQAWWRGQMVRHCLGPYRKKKKDKKDKKGGKEKKGGKK